MASGYEAIAHQYDGILLSNREEWTTDTHKNMDKFTCILLSERSQTPKAPYSDSFRMTLWKTYEYREEKRSVAARGCWTQGGRCLYRSGAEEFWGDGTVLCGTVGLDTRLYTFVENQRTVHPKVNCRVCKYKHNWPGCGGNLRWNACWDGWLSTNELHNHDLGNPGKGSSDQTMWRLKTKRAAYKHYAVIVNLLFTGGSAFLELVYWYARVEQISEHTVDEKVSHCWWKKKKGNGAG